MFQTIHCINLEMYYSILVYYRYTFIRNSGYKEHIFMVPMSSL